MTDKQNSPEGNDKKVYIKVLYHQYKKIKSVEMQAYIEEVEAFEEEGVVYRFCQFQNLRRRKTLTCTGS